MPTQPSIPPGLVNEYQLRLRRQRQVWFIPLADERMPYLSVLEVCSRRGAIQICVYLTLQEGWKYTRSTGRQS